MHSKDYQAHRALAETARKAHQRRPMAIRVPTYWERKREAWRSLAIDVVALATLAACWYAAQILLTP